MTARLQGLRQRLRANRRVLGSVAGFKWSVLQSLNHRRLVPWKSASVHPAPLEHAVSIRMGDSSDVDTFDQMFVRGELKFAEALRATRPRLIVDLGANVGYASAFLLSLFVDAFALAVEPDPRNVARCRANLAPYADRARVIEGAVWSRCGQLVLSRGTFGDGRDWATEVREARAGEQADVTAYDVPALLARCPMDMVDLLKIDIEGSETALFSANVDRWIDRVRNICIELHGERCRQAFFEALHNHTFETAMSGEYLVCTNIRRRT
jgi:FkbM family methyltransferase